jgi:6,7-dimethyl-8-ribityllumazine synthase
LTTFGCTNSKPPSILGTSHSIYLSIYLFTVLNNDTSGNWLSLFLSFETQITLSVFPFSIHQVSRFPYHPSLMLRVGSLFLFGLLPMASWAFVPTIRSGTHTRTLFPLQAAESEVSFDADLDGSAMRIGIIRTRWNDEHVTNLVDGIKQGLRACQVEEDNIFETSVPGAFELPMAARFLALSGTVDAIITTGVLIKGETMHFEYISDAVAKGIMNIGLQTSTPVIFGVLTCLDEAQVQARSSGDSNHGVDWGKTAVEMALLRTEAMGGKAEGKAKLKAMGFSEEADKLEKKKKEGAGFF